MLLSLQTPGRQISVFHPVYAQLHWLHYAEEIVPGRSYVPGWTTPPQLTSGFLGFDVTVGRVNCFDNLAFALACMQTLLAIGFGTLRKLNSGPGQLAASLPRLGLVTPAKEVSHKRAPESFTVACCFVFNPCKARVRETQWMRET